MSDYSLVSIIVPVYNAEKHLRRCVESILQQTYTNFELLLIDDGSTDSSGQICDEYAVSDSRVRVFHKPNGGVSSARNYGLLRNRGGYLTFVDSDDWIDKCHIQNFMDNADGYDWVMQGLKNVDDLGQIVKDVRLENTVCAVEKDKVDRTLVDVPAFGWVSNKLFKASIVNQNALRFITTSSINEDRVFNLEYSVYVNSFLMLPTATYNYVANPNSLTHSWIHPDMFLSTAVEFDKLVGIGTLGNNVSVYTGFFCIRFYIHALGLCLISPLSKLPLAQRRVLLCRGMKNMLHSYTVRRYKLKTIWWMLAELGAYVTKFLTGR